MLEKDFGERVSEVWRAQDRLYDHNATVSGIHQQMSRKSKTSKTKLVKFKLVLQVLHCSHIPFSSKILNICI